MEDWIIPNWHPLLVHFTIALPAVAAVLAVVAAVIRDDDRHQRVTRVAEWNFWIGAAVTVLTLLAGWRAFNTVAHDDPAHRMMLDHRNWALVTAGWILLMAVWLVLRRRAARRAFNVPFAAAALVLLGLIGTTAWHGAELVYRHGLGVMSLPEAGHDHGAAHGGGHGHSQHGRGAAPGEPEGGARHDSEHGHGGHDH